jgi:hypothetical protein
MGAERKWPLIDWDDWPIVLVIVLGLLAFSDSTCGVSVRIDSRASHPNPAVQR